ncbi:hypothetical protein ACIQYF_17120 [Pseudomonas sp. NPDC096917]
MNLRAIIGFMAELEVDEADIFFMVDHTHAQRGRVALDAARAC